MYRGIYMANFDFLKAIVEYKVFADAAIALITIYVCNWMS